MMTACDADETGYQPRFAVEMNFPGDPGVGKLVSERISKRVIPKIGIPHQVPEESTEGRFSCRVAACTLLRWLGPYDVQTASH